MCCACGPAREKPAPEEAPPPDKWTQEAIKQPQRRALIQKTINLGIFRKVEYRELGATIWVDATFYLLDFETKQGACSVVYAYVATNARDEMVGVTLKDVQSGKTVGEYGQQWTGIGLKMK